MDIDKSGWLDLSDGHEPPQKRKELALCSRIELAERLREAERAVEHLRAREAKAALRLAETQRMREEAERNAALVRETLAAAERCAEEAAMVLRAQDEKTQEEANTERYIGERNAAGQKHGHGKWWFNKRVYEGQFVNDVMHGFGSYTWPNRKMYEGQWEHGLKHGQGKLTLTSGEVSYEGQWVRDQRLETAEYAAAAQTAAGLVSVEDVLLFVQENSAAPVQQVVQALFRKIGDLISSNQTADSPAQTEATVIAPPKPAELVPGDMTSQVWNTHTFHTMVRGISVSP